MERAILLHAFVEYSILSITGFYGLLFLNSRPLLWTVAMEAVVITDA